MRTALRHPLNLPGASNLLSYLRPSQRLTLHGTLDGSGAASPPAVTMSGAGLSKTQNIELDMPVGGARGTAEFRWRQWGGAWSSNILTAASVDLSGTAIAVTLAFATGTYNTAHVYRSVVGTILDVHGNTFDGSSASASVRPFVGTLNGRPSLRSDGVARSLRTTTSALSTALVGGEDTALTPLFVAQYRGPLTPTDPAIMLSFCDGSAGSAGLLGVGVSPAGAWRVVKRGDSGGTNNQDGGTADNDPHVFEVFHTGTAVSLLVDGTVVINAAAQNVPSVTAQFVLLGTLSTAGVPPTEFPADCDIGEVALYSGVRTAAERAYIRQNLKNTYGL